MNSRQDIIISLLKFINNNYEASYDTFISSYSNPSIQGQVFELIIIFLITLKCFENIEYESLLDGKIENGYSSLSIVKNFKKWLNKSLGSNNGKLNDFIIKNNEQLIVFTIKYVCNDNTSKSAYDCDLEKIFLEGKKKYKQYNYKISLILNTSVKDIKNKNRETHSIINQIKKDKLLLTSNDVKKAWKKFCKDYKSKNFDSIIQIINYSYLKLKKEKLTPFLHQKMASNQLENWFRQNDKIAMLSHVMRSGKSITILLLCELLLRKNMCQKILIMTSAVNTITSFIQEIEKYIEFKDIQYKKQEEYIKLEENFKGIIFCSTQFLKMDITKKKYKKLLNLNFDLMIVDESHYGNSNIKTFSLLYEPNDIDDKIIYNFQKKMKKTLFSSGTPQKTNIFYKISFKNIFKWSYIDESYIKILNIENNESLYDYMINRHGNLFTHHFEDETINKNYDNKPIPIFLTIKWNETFKIMINQYNQKNNTNFGVDLSFLALEKRYNNKNEIIYETQFQICSTTDGEDLLKEFLNIIISCDKNQPSLMKQIEINQTKHKSRKSTRDNPLMFIIYLPTHTNHSNIYELQVALYNFIIEHNLWNDYYISYSCSKGNSLNQSSLEYNDFLRQIMNKTKELNKRGCILFLGDQGNLGITYPYCDVTICLDNSHNIDSLEQKKARSLTQAFGKTIGINVDLNIHRFYNTLYYYCIDYRKETKSIKTNAEILEYFYKYNIFLFDVLDYNFNYNQKDLKIDFEEFSKNMISNLEHDNLLEIIQYNDDLKDIIKQFIISQNKLIKEPPNDDDDDNIPKAGEVKIKGNPKPIKEKREKEEDLHFEINYTLEFCKRFIPFLCYLCKSLNISNIFDILNMKKYIKFFLNLKYFKSEINNDSYNKIIEVMTSIIENNMEIIHAIKEIYLHANHDQLRELFAKHFIPTEEERKQNAEIATPVSLVNEMLSKIPLDFWTKPQKVFEPCCGKGNFVLGIFDCFFKGLEIKYPNINKRCRIIIEKCIYYADINELDVFITTELLKYNAMKHGMDENKAKQLKFNSNVGNTLELEIKEKWKINGFEAVIGNPPYNDNGGIRKGGKNLYSKFSLQSLKWILNDGYLLFIVPIGILKSTNYKQPTHFMIEILKYKMLSININECSKYFLQNSTFTYFLIYKSKNQDDRYINDIVFQIKNKVFRIEKVNVGSLHFIPIILHPLTISILNKITLKNKSINFKRVDKTIDIQKYKDKFIYVKRLNHINYKNPYLNPLIGNKNTIVKGPILITKYTKDIEILLKSKIIAFLNVTLRYDAVIYHYLFNLITIDDNININEEQDIYKYYNLSNEEIDFINLFI